MLFPYLQGFEAKAADISQFIEYKIGEIIAN